MAAASTKLSPVYLGDQKEEGAQTNSMLFSTETCVIGGKNFEPQSVRCFYMRIDIGTDASRGRRRPFCSWRPKKHGKVCVHGYGTGDSGQKLISLFQNTQSEPIRQAEGSQRNAGKRLVIVIKLSLVVGDGGGLLAQNF